MVVCPEPRRHNKSGSALIFVVAARGHGSLGRAIFAGRGGCQVFLIIEVLDTGQDALRKRECPRKLAVTQHGARAHVELRKQTRGSDGCLVLARPLGSEYLELIAAWMPYEFAAIAS